MGKTFELISDNAIEKLDEYYTECHVCEKTDIDLYPYQGQVILENSEIDHDIYAVCYDCLQSQDLAHSCSFLYIEIIKKYLDAQILTQDRKEELKEILAKKYNQTPDIPIFRQWTDLPLCCEDITEFSGYPQNDLELFEVSENYIYWEKTIREKNKYYDFKI